MDRRYGTTSSQGYGSAHQRLRKAWAGRVAAGGVDCARCGHTIERGQAWDLGHVDGTGKAEYQGPEHRSCNRAAGVQVRQAADPRPRPRRRRARPTQ